jgi:drug/metabolite transporter (DMT)-like permease
VRLPPRAYGHAQRESAVPERDWIIIIILGFGWGTSFFFNEVLLREMGPLSVSFMRVSMAAVFCWAWLALRGKSPMVAWNLLPQFAFLGAMMFAIPFAVYPLGQQYVASGVAGIVNALTPVMVVIVSHFWPDGERATVLKSLGVLAGFFGIALLTTRALSTGEPGQLWGTLLIMLAPVSYAIAMNYIRRLFSLNVDVVLAWSFSFASLFMLPFVVGAEQIPTALSWETWGAVAVLGCVLTGASFMVAFRILPRAGATKTSTVTFIAPVSAVLIGYFVLQEELGALHFAGMASIFFGLLLIDGRLFRRKSENPSTAK